MTSTEDRDDNTLAELVARFAVEPSNKGELVARLQEAGEAAKPALLAGMRHPSWRVRHGCLRVLDHTIVDDETRRVVVGALADPHRKVRHAALHVLRCEQCKPAGYCGIDGVDIDEVIRTAIVSDASLRIRRSAVSYFRDPDRLTPTAIAAIERAAATTDDPELRRRAETVLAMARRSP